MKKYSAQICIVKMAEDLTLFCILLTVHLVMILGKWPTWYTILFYVCISILYMFRATTCSSLGESIVQIQHLVYVTLCRFLSDLHTKRSQTQSDIYQMLYWYSWFSWWWARGCSKHVENWNKYIEKNCASNWSFTKNLTLCFSEMLVTMYQMAECQYPDEHRKLPQ